MPKRPSIQPAELHGVPAEVMSVVELITDWIDAFCDVYLDAEYAHLSRKMLAKLARKRPTPLVRGELLICAVSAVWTVGQLNFLDDRTQTPHMTLDEFSQASDVTTSSLSRKSRVIAQTLKIREFDPEFCRRDVAAQTSASWLAKVDGIIVDARMLPLDLQAEARRLGLIPAKTRRKPVGQRSRGPTAPAPSTSAPRVGRGVNSIRARVTVRTHAKRYGVDRYTAHTELTILGVTLSS